MRKIGVRRNDSSQHQVNHLAQVRLISSEEIKDDDAPELSGRAIWMGHNRKEMKVSELFYSTF